MHWRGLSSDPECEHSCCSRAPRCLFSQAPVFFDDRAQRRYRQACRSFASNEQGLHHGTSLLTSLEALEGQVLQRRARVLRELGPARVDGCREFLVNKRDAPLDLEAPLKVLSQYVGEGSADLRMPNLEDYRRSFRGARFGPRGQPEEGLPTPPPWRDRWSCAVFRGSASGEGIDVLTNPRLHLAYLSQRWALEAPEEQLLDARLTSWNQRQKIGRDGVLRVLDPEALRRDYGLADVGRHHYLSWRQQSRYKYAVYVDGNVGAGRLGALLGLGFVLLVPSSEKPATFLRGLLEPLRHFVPVRADLRDLREALRWLRDHDEEARAMSERNRALHRACCSPGAIEQQTRTLVASLPCCLPELELREGLERAWRTRRCAVYVLLDDRMKLRIFAPFANPRFRNDWTLLATEDETLEVFLERVRRLTGECVTLPLDQWWTNGGLVCNQPVPDVWGEAMLPELRHLLEALQE